MYLLITLSETEPFKVVAVNTFEDGIWRIIETHAGGMTLPILQWVGTATRSKLDKQHLQTISKALQVGFDF